MKSGKTDAFIHEAVRRLKKTFKPEKIILFGSRAWGTPTPASDVDILVVLSDSDERPSKRAARAYHSLEGLGIPADVIVSTVSELERYRNVAASLTSRILRDGKVVYGGT